MKIKKINKAYLEKNIENFIDILKDVPNEYWKKKHFLIELKDKWQYSLLAENEGEMVGYIIASNKIDSIHIHKFMVKNSYRSKGLGLLLLKEYEKNCFSNEKSLITLKVYENNKRAISFYLKNGFILEQDKNEGLLLMSKEL